ncbi:MAG: type III secretion system export apparatus subunit SctS [Gammaproteobacteria bacterium]|nr:type III secretion system export apparatus subunit SctS [Gammaproteobacteria bacterium]MDE0365953.1 type III secretion system export apparatus subunit SctS [Gammaproteobacteria bacterium]
MSEAEIINHSAQALLLVLVLSMPPIAVASLVGIIVGLFQALTQIQEQTISFAFKLAAIILVLFLTMGWVGAELISYGMESFDRIERIR